jgi:hypothetical protein
MGSHLRPSQAAEDVDMILTLALLGTAQAHGLVAVSGPVTVSTPAVTVTVGQPAPAHEIVVVREVVQPPPRTVVVYEPVRPARPVHRAHHHDPGHGHHGHCVH